MSTFKSFVVEIGSIGACLAASFNHVIAINTLTSSIKEFLILTTLWNTLTEIINNVSLDTIDRNASIVFENSSKRTFLETLIIVLVRVPSAVSAVDD